MNTTETPVSKHTFQLAKIFTLLQNTETYCKVLAKEKSVGNKSKELLRTITFRATASINDFASMLSPESRNVMRSEMLNDEVTLQMEHINDMLYALPKGVRDQAETYLTGLYNVYALNK